LERLALSKQAAQKMDMDRFNLKKLTEGEFKEQYQVTITNNFAVLENLENNGDTIRQNIKISAKDRLRSCESQQHKPQFDEQYSKLVDRRKQAKLQWLQNTSKVNEDKLSNVREEDGRNFRNKRSEYLTGKINDLESNSKNTNIRDLYRGTNEFKRGYQPQTNLVKDDRGNLLADPHQILNRWKNYFCQQLNVQRAGHVRQTEMHRVTPFEHSPVTQRLRLLLGS
jgi:hypothetical protein